MKEYIDLILVHWWVCSEYPLPNFMLVYNKLMLLKTKLNSGPGMVYSYHIGKLRNL